MPKRIKAKELPEFDAAAYLDDEAAIAAYLTDILEANDAALLAAALGDIARARGDDRYRQVRGHRARSLVQGIASQAARRGSTPSVGSALRSASDWWLSRSSLERSRRRAQI